MLVSSECTILERERERERRERERERGEREREREYIITIQYLPMFCATIICDTKFAQMILEMKFKSVLNTLKQCLHTINTITIHLGVWQYLEMIGR